jgi:hypothetical protein
VKISTYMRATLVMTDGEHPGFLIGLCDRIEAQTHFKKSLEQVDDQNQAEADLWLSYAAWSAAKRQLKESGTFESWCKRYIGLDRYVGAVEDDQESPGTTPA